jgi:transposase-like protein
VVLDRIKGRTTAAEIARQHDVTVGDVEKWVETSTQAGEESLRSNPRERDERHEAEKNRLHAKIGELTLEFDAEKNAWPRSCGAPGTRPRDRGPQ